MYLLLLSFCAGKGNTGSETINISYVYHFPHLLKIDWKFEVYTFSQHKKNIVSACSLSLSLSLCLAHCAHFPHPRLKICLPCARKHQTDSFCVHVFCVSSSHDLQHIYHSHTLIVAYRSSLPVVFNGGVSLIKSFLSFGDITECVARKLKCSAVASFECCSSVIGGRDGRRSDTFFEFEFSEWLRAQWKTISCCWKSDGVTRTSNH